MSGKKVEEENLYGKEVLLGIRPEDIVYEQGKPTDTSLEVEVDLFEMLGHEANLYFKIEDTPMISIVNSRVQIEEKSKVTLTFDMEHCHLFDKETQLRIC